MITINQKNSEKKQKKKWKGRKRRRNYLTSGKN